MRSLAVGELASRQRTLLRLFFSQLFFPPPRADLLRAVRQGELCTWAKLSAIQCNCGIESTLDACIQQVGYCFAAAVWCCWMLLSSAR